MRVVRGGTLHRDAAGLGPNVSKAVSSQLIQLVLRKAAVAMRQGSECMSGDLFVSSKSMFRANFKKECSLPTGVTEP